MHPMQSLKKTTTHAIPYICIVLFAVIGFINAFTIYEKLSAGVDLQCIVGQPNGCDRVLYSSYATFLGVELAVWGLIFYGIIFALGAWAYNYPSRHSTRILFWSGGVGLAFSLYLLYAQLFLIGSLCSSCILSLVDSSCIFFASWRGRKVFLSSRA